MEYRRLSPQLSFFRTCQWVMRWRDAKQQRKVLKTNTKKTATQIPPKPWRDDGTDKPHQEEALQQLHKSRVSVSPMLGEAQQAHHADGAAKESKRNGGGRPGARQLSEAKQQKRT
jgi:hypothetical protein